jgi:hypothetical protein
VSQFALDHCESIGVWGGTTDPERRKLRRAMLADDGRAVVPPRLLWKYASDGYTEEPVTEVGRWAPRSIPTVVPL